MKPSRCVAVLFVSVFLAAVNAATNRLDPVELRWLESSPPTIETGVSWGVPWPKGAVSKTESFSLTTRDGTAVPLQTWPLAYWPDGSLKWSGFATVVGSGDSGPFSLIPGAPPTTAAAALRVRESDTTIEIDTGKLKCRVLKWGGTLIETLSVDGREVARRGELVCILQNGPDGDVDEAPRRERFTSKLTKVTVEKSGPVRGVLKLEGVHRAASTGREWLPFVVRLYFFAGQQSLRLVHTIIYDGDDQRDFIRGLGLEFAVPMREEVQNRHVRFSGENGGLWSEPIQPMVGRGGRFVTHPDGGQNVLHAGEAVLRASGKILA